jgi:hypothetical protein
MTPRGPVPAAPRSRAGAGTRFECRRAYPGNW